MVGEYVPDFQRVMPQEDGDIDMQDENHGNLLSVIEKEIEDPDVLD